MVDAGNRSCALEASSHASVQHRLDGTRFATLAFTNLSRDHLDFHGSIERYFDAKRRLFLMGDRPPAAVAIGDQWGQRLADELRLRGDAPVVTFSLDREADARAEDVEELPDGIRLRVGDLPLRTRLRGRFNLWNVLAAVTSARLLGVADDAIASGVARLDGVPGRLEPVDEGQPFTVLVDYAHTPDSLATALGAARSLATGRVISVFGCGGDRDPGKRPAMGEVSSRLADVTVVTSDNPRSEDPEAIVAEILAGVTGDVTVELDRRAAITRAIESAHPGDVVVVAGRGHEREQEIAGALYPLDDRQVAREALRALLAAA
jgi:UDP-N-acetylmuramoyl-L-alanyl-D-glutamate--2,6-diaminopimelate ligase